MVTVEEEHAERQRLKEALEELAAITPEDLARRELGPFDFSGGVPFFRRTLDLFEKLRQASLDDLPYGALKQLADQALTTLLKLKEVQDFDAESVEGNPGPARDKLIEEIRDGYDRLFDIASPRIAYATRLGADVDAIQNQVREAAAEIEDLLARAQEEYGARSEEAESLLASIRTVAAESGVAEHAIHFANEAKAEHRDSYWWLGATLVVAAVTVGLAIWAIDFWINVVFELTVAQAIQIGLAKLAVFSVLYFALIWCGRNFLAHRHNYTVNKHRQNALRTFEAFVKAASDEQTKNAVLLQSTQAIFSPQSTGYVGGDSDTGARGPQILEFVRNLQGEGRVE